MKFQLPANSLANRPRRPRYRAESPAFTNHKKIRFQKNQSAKIKKGPQGTKFIANNIQKKSILTEGYDFNIATIAV